MYAIIATGGKQYKVAEGDVIKVERLGAAAGEAVTFDQVLAVNNGEMKIGCPTVEGATVSATVVKEGKGKKVIVYKYKRKTGYHKKNGHRQLLVPRFGLLLWLQPGPHRYQVSLPRWHGPGRRQPIYFTFRFRIDLCFC